MRVFSLVFRGLAYLALGAVSFLSMLVLLLGSSQVLTINGRGVQVFMDLRFVVAACVIALLFALLLPLQVYAFRTAATATGTGGTILGALVGTASMSCCAPVLLPSLLALLGFSGATILSFNLAVERFWLPLATVSVILLAYSLLSVTSSLEPACHVAREGIWSAQGVDGSAYEE